MYDIDYVFDEMSLFHIEELFNISDLQDSPTRLATGKDVKISPDLTVQSGKNQVAGIVFQDFQLLMDRSVIQNLYFVLKATGWKKKEEIHDRAMHCLRLVGIEDQAQKMPHELSGGEQQRVSIGRALLNKPKLILADEPTGNLDPETSEEIMNLLIAIAKEEKTAILMATHDMHIVNKFPNRIVTVQEGLVINNH